MFIASSTLKTRNGAEPTALLLRTMKQTFNTDWQHASTTGRDTV